jgi:opacity protein-like surface antigen
MRPIRLLALAFVFLSAGVLPARADLTAFIGTQTSASRRPTTGVAVGSGVLVIGFEIEYAQARQDNDCVTGTATCSPSLRTGMFNVLIQTPRHVIPRTQLYVTVGGGYYRERFESLDIQATGAGTNVGGGAKIDLAGPVRLRLDYRVFKLGSEAVYDKPQRFTVGLNVAF